MTTRDPHTDPPDDRLGEALRSLPRHRPRDGFTGRVLDRLAEAGEAPRRPRALRSTLYRAAAATVVGAAVVAGLGAGLLLPGAGPATAPEDRRSEARRESLEAERARLEAELADLRRMAAELTEESAPVLYLGGDDEVDLVLDLGRLAREAQGDPRYRLTTYDQEADTP